MLSIRIFPEMPSTVTFYFEILREPVLCHPISTLCSRNRERKMWYASCGKYCEINLGMKETATFDTIAVVTNVIIPTEATW